MGEGILANGSPTESRFHCVAVVNAQLTIHYDTTGRLFAATDLKLTPRIRELIRTLKKQTNPNKKNQLSK